MNITTQRQEVKTALWKRGNLQSCLRPHQCDLYVELWNAINSKTTRFSVCASRRWNKTSTSLLVAFEYCQKYSNARVLFVGPVRGEMRQFVKTICFNILMRDIIPDEQPEYLESQFLFKFKNGSVLRLGATNNQNAENLRGAGEDFILIDEAAAVDNLEYVIKSILQPMLLTSNGLLVCLSTPGTTTDNYFTEFHRYCTLKGNAIHRTVHTNTSLTPDQINQAIEDCGGEHTTTWRREYLAEFVTDTESAIIPEWDSKYIEQYVTDRYYQHYHHFVSLDWGVVDQTAILFATFDFLKQQLFIEKEIIIKGTDVTIDNIASLCKQAEKELNWTNPLKIFRTGDSSDKIVMQSLAANYEYNIATAKKTLLHEMVAECRTLINNNTLRTSPDCKMLNLCLEAGIWDKHRKAFDRSKTFGHADALASLVYLVRIAKRYFNSNPLPQGLDVTFTEIRYGNIVPQKDPEISFEQTMVWKQAFKRK